MPVHPLLLTSCALFSLGIYGILTRRNAIGILLSIELMLNAASLNFVLFGRWAGGVDGQVVAIFVMALAACEAAVGLAIIIGLYRAADTVLADEVNLLKG